MNWEERIISPSQIVRHQVADPVQAGKLWWNERSLPNLVLHSASDISSTTTSDDNNVEDVLISLYTQQIKEKNISIGKILFNWSLEITTSMPKTIKSENEP